MQGYSTVAVIAVTPGVPLQNIAAEIVYSLQELGTAVCITPEVVKTNLGFNALDQSNDFKLTAWLGAQEDHYNTVIYLVSQEESSVPGWHQTHNFTSPNMHVYLREIVVFDTHCLDV